MHASPAEEKIINSFVGLYQERGADRIRVKDVCERAGVSRTTFYTYFESVSHLLGVIEDTVQTEVGELFRDFQYLDINQFRATDRPFPMFVRIYEYIEPKREVFKALFGPHANHRFILEYNATVKDSMTKILRGRVDATSGRIVSSLCEGAIVQVSQDWIFGRNDFSPEELGLICTRAVVAIIEEWEP